MIKLADGRISIHALRGEGDACVLLLGGFFFISIHALRGEGDPQEFAKAFGVSAFQSTPSVGRATEAAKAFYKLIIFQSTPSVGRATSNREKIKKILKEFQSTPSVGRATRFQLSTVSPLLHFNPRPPWGGRRVQSVRRLVKIKISIHALRGEGD